MCTYRCIANLVTFLALLLCASAELQANPADARKAAVSIIAGITSSECEIRGSIHWPLYVDAEWIEEVDRLSLCSHWRPKLLVARIQNVYAEEFASDHYRHLDLGGTRVFLVDTMTGTSTRPEQGSGASLVFDCPDGSCRLIGMMSTPLHRDSNRVLIPDAGQELVMLGARLATAISSLSAIKLHLVEYYYSMGQWPDNVEQLGLDPTMLYSQEIEALAIGSDGTIRVRLSQAFGNGKFLELQPYEEMSGTSLRWRCRSNMPYAVLTQFQGLDCQAL